ncbi:hypothetical protein ACFE04_002788 [Oxalis oulophora]
MANETSVMAVIRASRPNFRNNYDKAAFAIHSSFIASGYTLTATGPHAFDDSALSSSSTVEVGIDHWNDREDEYAFLYVNPKNLKRVLVKCLVIGDKLVVDALANGASAPVHLEVNVNDYVNVDGGENYADQYKNLEHLVDKANEEFLNKLDDSKKKPAASDVPSSSTQTHEEESRQDLRDVTGPGVGFFNPRGPMVDRSGFVVPPINPYEGSDLFPGPGAGMYPTRGDFGGGSMLVGPNDPRWLGGMQRNPSFPNPGVPPGARFDPFGPPGVPGFEPERFRRNPRNPPGHPDLEHFGGGGDFI